MTHFLPASDFRGASAGIPPKLLPPKLPSSRLQRSMAMAGSGPVTLKWSKKEDKKNPVKKKK